MTNVPPPPGYRPPVPPPPSIANDEHTFEDVTIEAASGKLEVLGDEIDEIQRRTLKPHHARDPNILQFINLYLVNRDAAQSAKQLGLTALDGRRRIARKDIAECVRQITALAVNKYEYTAEEVIERVKELAYVDPAEMERPDGKGYVTSLRELPLEVRRCIRKLRVRQEYLRDSNGMLTGEVLAHIIDYDFHDKAKPLELLGSEKEMFKKRKVVEHEIGKNMRDTLLESRDKAAERLLSYRNVGGSDE